MNSRDRLQEIQEEMLNLMDEAKTLLRQENRYVLERAQSYWIPQIEIALSREHNYVASCICCMEDTIAELDEGDDQEEDDEEA